MLYIFVSVLCRTLPPHKLQRLDQSKVQTVFCCFFVRFCFVLVVGLPFAHCSATMFTVHPIAVVAKVRRM